MALTTLATTFLVRSTWTELNGTELRISSGNFPLVRTANSKRIDFPWASSLTSSRTELAAPMKQAPAEETAP